MMKLTALKVDPEFQGKIPPLTFEELEQLEKNIVNDGKVINPIIVWNRLIVDGHNRYAILQKHPDIPYQPQSCLSCAGRWHLHQPCKLAQNESWHPHYSND